MKPSAAAKTTTRDFTRSHTLIRGDGKAFVESPRLLPALGLHLHTSDRRAVGA